MKKWLAKRLQWLPVSRQNATPLHTPARRVEWTIKDSPLWFESDDTELSNEPEAIACLCSAASSLKGWRVKFPEPICPVLAENFRKREVIWLDWWNTFTSRFRTTRQGRTLPPLPERGTAVFLSLGVDSFFSAITLPQVDTVIYVCGYDISISDVSRLEEFEVRLREVGRLLEKRVIVLRTNLREHPVFRKLDWEKFHGAALAAVAHLLKQEVGTVLISSSFSAGNFSPWGTSWKTDALWSSSAVALEHAGHELTRFQKLEKIAYHPAIREHLHVCWEHRNERFNCGLCEKCQRTMLGLVALGQLEHFKTLPDETGLADAVRASPFILKHIWPTYRAILKHEIPTQIREEVELLLERSKEAGP